MKICKVCSQSLPATAEHYPVSDGRLRPICIKCYNARRRAAYQADSPARTPAAILAQRRGRDRQRTQRQERRLLEDELAAAIARQQILDRLQTSTPPPILPREHASGLREATAVVLCSDWHVEEPIPPEKVNGLNEYDMDIAERRIERLAHGTTWLIEMMRERFTIRDLVLWLGGDLMSGYIHEELVEGNSLSPIETVVWLQQRLRTLIQSLLDLGLERLLVPCSVGNHGRTTQRPRVSSAAENSYEWLLYRWLADHYRDDPRVTISAPRSQLLYLEVYDKVVRFTHGDAVRYAGGVGGVTIPLAKAITMGWDRGRRADITCVGHWHQYLTLPHVVVNGSLCGYSPFAVRCKAAYEPPTQSFFLIDSRRGVTAHCPLWVSDGSRRADHVPDRGAAGAGGVGAGEDPAPVVQATRRVDQPAAGRGRGRGRGGGRR